MHFYSIFLSFPFQGVHGNHFSHFHIIFDSLLFVSLPNTWKWAKNGPKMATVNNPNNDAVKREAWHEELAKGWGISNVGCRYMGFGLLHTYGSRVWNVSNLCVVVGWNPGSGNFGMVVGWNVEWSEWVIWVNGCGSAICWEQLIYYRSNICSYLSGSYNFWFQKINFIYSDEISCLR